MQQQQLLLYLLWLGNLMMMVGVVVAARWAVLDRVEAAGLLPRTSGPHWSVFEKFRKAPIIDTLLDAGDIEEVQSALFFLFSPPSLRSFPSFFRFSVVLAPGRQRVALDAQPLWLGPGASWRRVPLLSCASRTVRVVPALHVEQQGGEIDRQVLAVVAPGLLPQGVGHVGLPLPQGQLRLAAPLWC